MSATVRFPATRLQRQLVQLIDELDTWHRDYGVSASFQPPGARRKAYERRQHVLDEAMDHLLKAYEAIDQLPRTS